MLGIEGLILWRTSVLLILLTYLLTLWSRVLLEMVTSSQLLKKFPAFYGTRRFVTTFTSARQLSPFHITYFIVFAKCIFLFQIFIFPPKIL